MTDIEDLYQRYHQQVYRFAFWLSGNAHEAEDIASETFLRAWAGADDLRAATVKAYLFTIARNLFLRGRRTTVRQRDLDDRLIDDRPGPDVRVDHRRRLERVLDGLARLPEMDRTALLMRVLDDLPYDQIAQTLGVSVSAAKVKVHRARLKLALLEVKPEVTP